MEEKIKKLIDTHKESQNKASSEDLESLPFAEVVAIKTLMECNKLFIEELEHILDSE